MSTGTSDDGISHVNSGGLWDQADRLLRLGHWLLPTQSGGKQPRRDLVPRGFLDASNDPQVVRKWFDTDHAPDLAIAAVQSRRVVIDVDRQSGGLHTLQKLRAAHPDVAAALDETVCASTPSGGFHYYLEAEDGVRYPGTLGPGIDVKHQGYVKAPPSRGYVWTPSRSPFDVQPVSAERLRAVLKPHSEEHATVANSVELPNENTVRELRIALQALDSDERTLWIDVGHALYTAGALGLVLYTEWSKRSSKYKEKDAAATWRSFKHSRSHWSAVFNYARDRADKFVSRLKVNGRPIELHTHAAHDWAGDRGPWKRVSLKGLKAHAVDYLIDGFLARGLMAFVGKHGIGKTTAMIALCAAVAGLRLGRSPLGPPVVGRKIIYISEDVDQIRNHLAALEQHFEVSNEEIDSAFVLLSTQRVAVDEIVKLRAWVEEFTTTTSEGVPLRPFIVFDTTSASFELEDENSNAQVAALLAKIKHVFYEEMGCAVCLVAHVQKGIGRDEHVTDPRGASAWGGDTTLTLGIFDEGGRRYVRLGKRRYAPPHTELKVAYLQKMVHATDLYGQSQEVILDAVELDWSDEDERAAASTAASEAEQVRVAGLVLRYLADAHDRGEARTLNDLKRERESLEQGLGRDAVDKAVNWLKRQGTVKLRTGVNGSKKGWGVLLTEQGIAQISAGRGPLQR